MKRMHRILLALFMPAASAHVGNLDRNAMNDILGDCPG